MKMYLVLSQVEHQTIECHRKNITIVYSFGLSVVSLSYCYKPGRPPLPASLACPGRPPLADLPYLLTHLPWHRLPLTLPWQTSPADLPWHRPPLTLPWQTSPGRPLPGRPPLSLTHLPGWARKKLKMMSVSSFFHCFIKFLSFFIILDSFIHFPLFPWRKNR